MLIVLTKHSKTDLIFVAFVLFVSFLAFNCLDWRPPVSTDADSDADADLDQDETQDSDSDGCDADVLSDPDNCGSCGNMCDLEHSTSECVDGQCVVAECDEYFRNRNGQDSDGCEYSCWETHVNPNSVGRVYVGNGYVWGTTADGLIRVDLDNISNIRRYTQEDGLPGPMVRSILLIDMEIYIATNNGVIVTDFDINPIRTLPLLSADHEGLGSQCINDMVRTDDGTMWFATNNDVSILRLDDTWVHVKLFSEEDRLVLDVTHDAAIHDESSVWFSSTSGGGACRIDTNGRVVECLTKHTEPAGLTGSPGDIVVAPDNSTIWFGLRNSGLDVYDIGADVVVNYGIEDGLPHLDLRNIAVDPTGVVWAATGFGLSAINTSSSEIQNLDTSGFGNLSSSLHDVVLNNEDVWISSPVGLSRYASRIWTDVGRDGVVYIPSNSVSQFTLDDSGNFWFAGSDGIGVYNGSTWRAYSINDIEPDVNTVVDVVSGPDNSVFISTNNGIYSCNNASCWERHEHVPDIGFSHMVVDRYTGDLWASRGCANRLWQFSEDLGWVEHIVRNIWCAGQMDIQSDGTVWVVSGGPPGHGVISYDPESNISTCHRNEDHPGCDEFVPAPLPGIGTRARWLTVSPRDVVWVAYSNRELYYFDGMDWGTLDQDEGLPGGSAFSVDFDSSERMWIGNGEAGLVCYHEGSFRAFVDPEEPSPISYQSVLVEDRDNVWVTTSVGLKRFTCANDY